MSRNNYAIAAALSKLHLFQYHYANVTAHSVVFTFAIHLRDVTEREALDIAERPFFVRSVDLVTGALVTTYDMTSDPLVIEALELHFAQGACVRDGLAGLDDYLKGGSGELERSDVYGQATHYSDLEELHLDEQITITPGERYYHHNSGRVTLD